MGDASETTPKQYYGTVRFVVPDLSLSAYDRGLFAFPGNKEVVDQKVTLHDASADPTLLTGRDGLDTQGFAYIKHRSALSESGDPATDWYIGNNVEDVYLPEVEKLVCDVTGAKKAVVNNVAFRRRIVDKFADPNFVLKRGDVLDQELAKIPKDVPLVYGKNADASLEPARIAHVDYTRKALSDTIRECRHDIKAAAKECIEAEDSNSADVPRYAAYSVWRPVRTVKRDPLAVCDMRTVEADECVPCPYRAVSDINADGEFVMEVVSVLPPKNPSQQKWYWMPEQKEDDVLFIKFADSLDDSSVMGGICGSGGAPHTSVAIEGTEEEEPRCSIEARVIAFW